MLSKALFKLMTSSILSLLFMRNIHAAEPAAHFQALFADWTTAFNNQELEKSCALFSKEVIATYQGVSQKNYDTICGGFKKVFSDKEIKYHYDFKIHQTYEDHHLGAVRITWYLKVYNKNKLIKEVQDEGLDILQKGKKGDWKIVNYIGFPTSE